MVKFEDNDLCICGHTWKCHWKETVFRAYCDKCFDLTALQVPSSANENTQHNFKLDNLEYCRRVYESKRLQKKF